jgi:hypothetical protein
MSTLISLITTIVHLICLTSLMAASQIRPLVQHRHNHRRHIPGPRPQRYSSIHRCIDRTSLVSDTHFWCRFGGVCKVSVNPPSTHLSTFAFLADEITDTLAEILWMSRMYCCSCVGMSS